MTFNTFCRSIDMELLPERYRRVDPDGVMNMAFVDDDTAKARRFSIKGKNPLEA